jgi:dihydrodipicolinate synthase/N-acetylneuraminate lyase
MNLIFEKRRALLAEMFPEGVPRLWCPLLTHYQSDGRIDFERMAAHFNHIVPWVKGFLIPGSTGDGWELDDEETLMVADFAMRQAETLDIRLLLGVLKSDPEKMKRTISTFFALGKGKGPTLKGVTDRSLRDKGVCAFTVCPPAGKTLSQAEIEAGLSQILDMDLPTALYQLPQVTGNEASAETFGRLVQAYSNLIFFKDSSGQDRIAMSAVEKGGVFLVRGAEGDYARWLKEADGPYDGFLLSTANCFPHEIRAVIEGIETGDRDKAGRISEKLTAVILEVFNLVQSLPFGNAFTNANKAIDHFFAFGPSARAVEGPMLHAKVRIPDEILSQTGDLLARHHLMPAKGYLAGC